MRYVLYVLMLVVLAGCQKEEFTVIEDPDEESILRDGQLKNLLMSVVSHDGSYDDIVDHSPCFSIDFPYVCIYRGHEYEVNSIQDLYGFDEGSILVPKFPINITFGDYVNLEVPNRETFDNLIALCANGGLWNESITCVDISYPIELSIYDPQTSQFQTVIFEHDKQTFQSIDGFEEDLVASIQYPIQILLPNNVVLTINSNEVLKTEILGMIPFCE